MGVGLDGNVGLFAFAWLLHIFVGFDFSLVMVFIGRVVALNDLIGLVVFSGTVVVVCEGIVVSVT